MRRRQGKPENIAPFRFDMLDAETHRELSQRGGVKSGESRRRKAVQRDIAFDWLASYDLARSTDEEYRAAVKKVMEQERRKRKKRKSKAPDE